MAARVPGLIANARRSFTGLFGLIQLISCPWREGGCERPLDLPDLTFQEAASFLEGRAQGLKQGQPADCSPPRARGMREARSLTGQVETASAPKGGAPRSDRIRVSGASAFCERRGNPPLWIEAWIVPLAVEVYQVTCHCEERALFASDAAISTVYRGVDCASRGREAASPRAGRLPKTEGGSPRGRF
jgi:hypothetical protein